MNQLLHVSASPHIKDRVTTSSIMLDVIIALPFIKAYDKQLLASEEGAE